MIRMKNKIQKIIEHDRFFNPTKADPEAKICLNCPLSECNPSDCPRFIEQKDELRKPGSKPKRNIF